MIFKRKTYRNKGQETDRQTEEQRGRRNEKGREREKIEREIF